MNEDRPWAVAGAGLLSLAVAMGIGRFAFTPLLPLILQDGQVDLPAATWLATANYLGYWLGAIACTLQPFAWTRWSQLAPWKHVSAVRGGLVATVLLTACMALPWPWLWPFWRFAAGVASAVVLIYTSGWCLARLGAIGAPALSGVIFMGPGLGIAVSGLAASGMVAAGWHAPAGWSLFAALAAILTAMAWPAFHGTLPPAATPPQSARARSAGVLPWVTVAYGLAGFGYIVTATFLPVIAREALPGSVWLDLFWPLFGLGVAAGAAMTIRLPPHWDRRTLLLCCYAVQAVGVLMTVWMPSLAGFALGSAFLGLPFTAISLFTMQEVRRLQPHNASAVIGLVTAAYGLGQIAGPPMVAALLTQGREAARGFSMSLEIAAAALVAGGLIFGALASQVRREAP
jgi:MFS family permease